MAAQLAGVDSWQLWSMKGLGTFLSDFLSSMREEQACTECCVQCGDRKDAFSFVKGDIPSMFTNIDGDSALSAAREVLTLAKHRTHGRYICAKRGTRIEGRITRQRSKSKSELAFTFDEVACLMAFALRWRVFRIGQIVMRQRTGLPMGGMSSMVMSGLALSAREKDFCREQIFARRRRGLFSQLPWRAVRYVDDNLYASTVLCLYCLRRVAESTYSGRLALDIEEVGSSVTFLDTHIIGTHEHPHIEHTSRNTEQVDALADMRVTRFLPFLGRVQGEVGSVRGMFQGHVLRALDCSPSLDAARVALRRVVMEWLLMGYPADLLYRFACATPNVHPLVGVLRAALRSLLCVQYNRA